jgi:hypothetical protein
VFRRIARVCGGRQSGFCPAVPRRTPTRAARLRTGQTTVTLDPARVAPEQLVAAIAGAGDYAAQLETL